MTIQSLSSILLAMDAEPVEVSAPATLTPDEVRVLGCLVEKSYTTPEYYPMTVNALINACNQKSSRHPVVNYDEPTVHSALDSLREKGWAILVRTAGARTLKYKHHVCRQFQFADKEIALLSVLMLRGPQTVGELRGRTERMASFADLAEVEETLRELASGYPIPLVKELPRRAGRKDHRFMHLFSGDVEPPTGTEETAPAGQADSQASRFDPYRQRIEHLEEQVRFLQEQFQAFQKQFE